MRVLGSLSPRSDARSHCSTLSDDFWKSWSLLAIDERCGRSSGEDPNRVFDQLSVAEFHHVLDYLFTEGHITCKGNGALSGKGFFLGDGSECHVTENACSQHDSAQWKAWQSAASSTLFMNSIPAI